MDPASAIRRRLKELRIEQKVLAVAADVTESYISAGNSLRLCTITGKSRASETLSISPLRGAGAGVRRVSGALG